jgi:hypothetical protein
VGGGFRVLKESLIESKSCTMAKAHGWWGIKLVPLKCAGLPDRMFIGHGRVVFIEYKIPGGKLRPIQETIHKKFKKHGIDVHVCTSVEETMKCLNENSYTNIK